MAQQKKSKKLGRSKRNGQAARYKAEFRAQKNKAVKVLKHYREHPHDVIAFTALKTLGGIIGKTLVEGNKAPGKPKNEKPGYQAWRAHHCGFKRGGEAWIGK